MKAPSSDEDDEAQRLCEISAIIARCGLTFSSRAATLAMKLILSPAAAKALSTLPRKDASALLAKLRQVAENPMGQYQWAKRLTGQPGFRVRQGDWRAIYSLNYSAGKMVVEKIAKRDEVYR